MTGAAPGYSSSSNDITPRIVYVYWMAAVAAPNSQEQLDMIELYCNRMIYDVQSVVVVSLCYYRVVSRYYSIHINFCCTVTTVGNLKRRQVEARSVSATELASKQKGRGCASGICVLRESLPG